MTTDLTTTAPAPLLAEDLAAAFDAFDAAAARFLATKKKRTAATYRPGLAIYRDVALDAGADPLRADALILFNQAMQARRRDRDGDLSPGTVRTRMKAVQSFFSWAWGYNLTPIKREQVADILDLPPARKLSPRDILTADEARRLIEAADDPEAHALVRVLLDGGLRISEALGIRCGDIYSESDRYFIHVADAKGDEPRTVEIPGDLYRELAGYAGGQGLDLKDPQLAELPLFDASRATAWRRVKAAASAAEISKRLTPHGLRHTHANTLAMLGWPLELIAERLGHKSMDTTRLYTRPAKMLMQMELPAMPWAEGE